MKKRPSEFDPELEWVWEDAYEKGHDDGWQQANNRVADLLGQVPETKVDKQWLLERLWR